jgi:phage terminase large subunit-like protein
MTKAVSGISTTIATPSTDGVYNLFVIDAVGNISSPSTATLTVDNTAPTNQDTVFAKSTSKKSGDSMTIISSGDATNNIWLAPLGATNFVTGTTITKATNGTATAITTPSTVGTYKLFVIDAVGNISSPSTATLTLDNTSPTNQNMVFTMSTIKKGNSSIAIASSGDATNNIWFAPLGTTNFVTGETMTKATSGTATTIITPANEGSYKLFVIDEAGNISTASTATLTIDNTAPINQDIVFSASVRKKSSVAIPIVSSNDTTNSIWFAPLGTTNFVTGSNMTKATSGTATTIITPATEGIYGLFVIDAVGNISLPSIALLTVNNTPLTTFTFKESSLGELSNVVFARGGGQHNLVATYQNNTDKSISTSFIVAVKKNNKIVSIYTTNKIFKPLETIDFIQTISIPSNIYNADVEVDFYLWDDVGTIKPMQTAVENIVNYEYMAPTLFSFKGSSLGEPQNITFAPKGGQHNLVATYQNNTNEVVSTTFIVSVKKAQRIVSLHIVEKTFQPMEIVDFSKTINIPSTLDGSAVEVDFFLWNGFNTMKTKFDSVKNLINNIN